MRPGKAIARLLPSMMDVAFIMPLVFLFCGMKGAQTLLGDGDTGWHLRTGEWILVHGRVPDHDIFSFTRAGQPWFAWEWLWDVCFGWVHRHAGMAAVVLGNSLLLGATFALLFRLARRRSDALVALVITLIAAGCSAGHWLARPHLCTMLLTTVFYGILERVDRGEKSNRRLCLLPPLMVLWTNLHGGFFVGIVLIMAYAAGHLTVLVRETTEDQRRASLQMARRYGLTAAGCTLTTLANPYGWRLHLHIARYLGDSFFRGNIMEFQSLNFQSGQARYLEILLAVGGMAAYSRLRRGSLTWPLLYVLWGHLALYSARNLEIFGLVAAVPAAEFISECRGRLIELRCVAWLRRALLASGDFIAEWNGFDREPRWPVASVASMLILAALLWAPRAPSHFRPEYDAKSYPVQAADLLEKAGIFSGIFTEDLWGGYLIYRHYPRGRVFMDGRSDFYGAQFSGEYIRAMRAQPGWEQFLSRYGVDTILLAPEAPLAEAVRQSSAWHLIYKDRVAQIFRSAQARPFPTETISPASLGRRTNNTNTKQEKEQS